MKKCFLSLCLLGKKRARYIRERERKKSKENVDIEEKLKNL